MVIIFFFKSNLDISSYLLRYKVVPNFAPEKGTFLTKRNMKPIKISFPNLQDIFVMRLCRNDDEKRVLKYTCQENENNGK